MISTTWKLYAALAMVGIVVASLTGAGMWFYHQGQVTANAKQADAAIASYAGAMERAHRERDDWIQVANSLSAKYIKSEQEYSDAKKRLASFDFSDTDTVNAGIAGVLNDIEEASRRFSTNAAGIAYTPTSGTDSAGAVQGGER